MKYLSTQPWKEHEKLTDIFENKYNKTACVSGLWKLPQGWMKAQKPFVVLEPAMAVLHGKNPPTITFAILVLN